MTGIELFSQAWFSALLSIIIIDLLLAGDNAIVIALAARNLPQRVQTKAVVFGTFGAVAIRIVGGIFAVFLLQIPYVALVGGVLLLWIAHTLVAEDNAGKHEGVKPATSLAGAIRTIIIADAVMGLDNVVAIAAAAKGEVVLVALGVLISIPIVMWGSLFVLKLLQRWPWLTWAGSALLGYIAVTLIFSDPLLTEWAAGPGRTAALILTAVGTLAFFAEGWWLDRRRSKSKASADWEASKAAAIAQEAERPHPNPPAQLPLD